MAAVRRGHMVFTEVLVCFERVIGFFLKNAQFVVFVAHKTTIRCVRHVIALNDWHIAIWSIKSIQKKRQRHSQLKLR
jgi:hypothetical protein